MTAGRGSPQHSSHQLTDAVPCTLSRAVLVKCHLVVREDLR